MFLTLMGLSDLLRYPQPISYVDNFWYSLSLQKYIIPLRLLSIRSIGMSFGGWGYNGNIVLRPLLKLCHYKLVLCVKMASAFGYCKLKCTPRRWEWGRVREHQRKDSVSRIAEDFKIMEHISF